MQLAAQSRNERASQEIVFDQCGDESARHSKVVAEFSRMRLPKLLAQSNSLYTFGENIGGVDVLEDSKENLIVENTILRVTF